MNPFNETSAPLNPSQRGRLEALRHARDIVGAPREVNAYPPALNDDAASRVVVLAEYILGGRHPALILSELAASSPSSISQGDDA